MKKIINKLVDKNGHRDLYEKLIDEEGQGCPSHVFRVIAMAKGDEN